MRVFWISAMDNLSCNYLDSQSGSLGLRFLDAIAGVYDIR